MPTSDPNKAYVKKHKINELLNDLFKSLTEQKPDDPIDYSFKYFEAKQPKPVIKEPTKEKQKTESNLLTQLFDKRNQISDKTGEEGVNNNLNVSHKTKASHNSSAMLSNYKILSKVNRILAKNNVQESNEDILDKENMIFQYSKDNEDNNEGLNHPKIIKYKNSWAKTSDSNRRRDELEALLTSEVYKKNKRHESPEDSVFSSNAMQNIEENEEMMCGELGGNKTRYSNKNEKNGVKHRAVGKGSKNDRFTPREITKTGQLICEVCHKLQEKIEPQKDVKPIDTNNKTLPQQKPNILNSLLDKTASKLDKTAKQLTGHDIINKNSLDQNNTNKIFDLLHSTDKTKKQESGDLKVPVTTKDTARSKGVLDDDDFIESASQVSGPRPIDPYDPLTNRSKVDQSSKLPLPSSGKNDQNSVMSWLMNKAQHESEASKGSPPPQAPAPITTTKTPSVNGSNVTLKSERSNNKTTKNESDLDQAWNVLASSSSERSSTVKHEKK